MARMRFRWALSSRCIVAASTVVFLTVASTAALAAPTLRTVALSGQPAPGTPTGVDYGSNFGTPVLNEAGRVAFHAGLSGTVTSEDNQGLWSEGAGSLALVARKGDQVPGTPTGVRFSSLDSLVLNDIGQVAFNAGFFGSGVHGANDSGLLVERSESIVLVAREGGQAAQLPSGAIYRNNFSFSVVLNNAGQTAFRGRVVGSGVDATNEWGVWSEGSGSLALLVRSGDPATDTSPGVVFTTPMPVRPFDWPVLNDAGQTAFRARLFGSGVDETNNFGIWTGTPGNLRLVARAGNEAPGTPDGISFANFTGQISQLAPAVALNDSGHTAFSAHLTGNGVVSTNDEGVWSEGSGSLALVARKGDHAPGTPSGVNFAGFSSPVLNAVGQTAFGAGLTGSGVDVTNRSGIWSQGLGSLDLVARTGNLAPGTPTGVNFTSFDGSSLVLNDAGQIAFTASLTGTGVNSGNDRGLWATDRSGSMQLIARKGELLELGPGDFRTIQLLSFVGGTGNGDGRPSGFNNQGQLAFHARFTDGSSGIFVSNLVAIPEPTSLVLVALGLIATMTVRVRFRA